MNTQLSSTIEAIGWSLLHFFWQGTLIAILLALGLQFVRKCSAQVRYLLAGAAFTAMVGVFALTLALHCPAPGSDESLVGSSVPVVPSELAGTISNSLAPESAEASPATGDPGADPREVVVAEQFAASTERTEEVATGVPASERIRPVLRWMVAAWMIGIVLLSLRLLTGWLRLRSWRSNGEEVTDPFWSEKFSALCEALKVSRPVRLFSSSGVAVPIVVGWLKPVILVPARLFTGLPESQLEAILAHELAHVRRHDYLVNLLQNVVETIFFFHPAVWWVSAQLRKEREHCCDDVASTQSGDVIDYARALTALEELRGAPSPSVAANGGSLIERVRRLLGVAPRSSRPALSWVTGVIVTALVVTLVIAGNPVHGQKEEGAAKEAPIVRGFSLEGATSTPNEEGVPTMTVEPPEDPDPLVYRKLYRLSLGEKDSGPWLLVPSVHHANSPIAGEALDYFFVQFEDRTYRAVGDPVKLLNLRAYFRERWATMKSIDVMYELIHLFVRKTEGLFVAACTAIPHLTWDDGPNEYHSYPSDTILLNVQKRLKGRAPSPDTETIRKAADFLERLARERIESRRVEIPDDEYDAGSPLDTAPGIEEERIVWSEPNEVGLRLGFSDISPEGYNYRNQPLAVLFYIRNDGKESVKLSTTRIFNDGVRASLIDEKGVRHEFWKQFGGSFPFARRKIDPGHFVQLESGPLSFGVGPGKYRFEAEQHIGQWHGPTQHAKKDDPSLIPGLGEWQGILRTSPMEIEIGAYQVVRMAAGEGTTEYMTGSKNMESYFARVRGRTGEITVTHGYRARPKLTTVWEKEPHHIWKSKTGECRAAYEVNAPRALWVVDGDTILCFIMGKTLKEMGRWPLAEASGDLRGMSDGVRKVLKLPARKPVPVTTPPVTKAPTVRGLSLAGIPVTPNAKGVAEAKAETGFKMMVGEKESLPRMICPRGKPHFYLEFKEEIYGPIEGNPFERLKLKELLVAQLRAMDEKALYSRLFRMLDTTDDRVLAVGYELVPELKDYGFNGIVAVIGANLTGRPLAPTAEAGKRALDALMEAKFAEVGEEARAKWEKTRVVIPDGKYRGGKPLGGEPPGIIWGDANEVGLRMGFSGLVPGKPIPLGRMLNLRLFIRNDGEEAVKFNTNSIWGGAFNIALTDESGDAFKLEKLHEGRGYGVRVRLAPDRFFECEFQPVQTILLRKDGTPATVLFEPTGFILNPGSYKVELGYNLGLFDVRSDWRGVAPRIAPAIGEWVGILKVDASGVEFGPPVIKTAQPGASTNHFDLHRLDFKEGEINLVHRVNWPVRKRIVGEIFDKVSAEWTGTPWGDVADVWKVKGEYRAAMDSGATRLWIVDESGIQFLQYHHEFHDRGHWSMDEARGDLADMPDGVRKALRLPPKVEPE